MKATMNEVKTALDKFVADIVAEGSDVFVDLSETNYEELLEAVNEEYECGQTGTVYDIIVDLNDSIGLAEFGIVAE